MSKKPVDPAGAISAGHHRALEAMYRSAPVNGVVSCRLRVGFETAQVAVTVEPRLFHAAGGLHGSMLFKALDDAAFFAAQSVVEDCFVVTASFHIELLSAVTEAGELVADGTVIKRGRQVCFAASEARFDDRVVARGSGVFARSPVNLVDVDAYRSVYVPEATEPDGRSGSG